MNRLPSRRFTCNVKHYFLWKIWKTCFENVVCQLWLALKGLTKLTPKFIVSNGLWSESYACLGLLSPLMPDIFRKDPLTNLLKNLERCLSCLHFKLAYTVVHQRMNRPEQCISLNGSGRQGKMKRDCHFIVSDAPMSSQVFFFCFGPYTVHRNIGC